MSQSFFMVKSLSLIGKDLSYGFSYLDISELMPYDFINLNIQI